MAESENYYSGYVVPVLLALTVSLLLCLSLGSLAIWKYYKVSRAFLSTEMLKLSVGGGENWEDVLENQC